MNLNLPGLTTIEVEKKRGEFGSNEIRAQGNSSPIRLILRQLKKNHILYLLMAAAFLSFLVDEPITGVVIILVLVLIVSITFVQEYKAEKALSALKKMVVQISLVIRDGKQQEVNSGDLVPGDILIIRNGDRVPADCTILEQLELKVDESILTGESREKSKLAITGSADTPTTEDNQLFMGSFVVSGKALARITHTGMNTKFGKISNLISETEKSLPLQDKVNRIAKFMVKVAMVIAFLTGGLVLANSGKLTGETITHSLVLVIAIAVSAFPEGLPVVMMTGLAVGATRMAKKNAIVNRMSIIESLGETTVICADKTGTITKGEMTVRKLILDGKIIDISGSGYSTKGEFSLNGETIETNANTQIREIMRCSALCNNASLSREPVEHEYKVIGSATEGALAIMAAKGGVFKEDLRLENISEIPFSSERKTMFVAGEIDGKRLVYAKGAPEYLLEHCKKIQLGARVEPLTEKERAKLLAEIKDLTNAALRTIALAYSPDPVNDPQNWHKELIFLGVAGMEDPPREEVAEAIAACRTSGIGVKMITGDNKETAVSIGNQIGLTGKVMEGFELDDLTDAELASVVKEVIIFARVRPEHKLRIVRALKENGEVVTMTGDGVNDAPALKEANIGVAMGKNGTDVSRSVADLTLKDDNFATIIEAIREGRTIFNNIRKFVTYQLSCNYAELFILLIGVILSPFLGWQVPLLLSLQILFMNLVTDDLPAITLSLNQTSKDVMLEKPRIKAEILNKDLYLLLFGTGMSMGVVVLVTYYLFFNILGYNTVESRTIALVTLIALEIVNAFSFRSFRYPVFGRSLFVNKYLVWASVISVAATLAIIYTPLNQIFGTTEIGIGPWIWAGIISLIFTAVYDGLKHKNNTLKVFDFS